MIDIRVDFNSVDERGLVTSLIHRATSLDLTVGMKVRAYDSDGNSVEAIVRALESDGVVALEKIMDTWCHADEPGAHGQGVAVAETSVVISGLKFGLTSPGFILSAGSEVQAS